MHFDMANLDLKGAHDILAGAVLPRPIAWVSTIGPDGIYNLAPFSFFAVVSTRPAMVGFSIGSRRDGVPKDTLLNIRSAKDFVVNVVTEELAAAMNQSCADYPRNVDEFKETGLTAARSDLVQSPRLAESPVNLECRLDRILEFGEGPHSSCFVIGEVLRVHVRDEVRVQNVIKADKLKPLGRLGEEAYCRTGDIFEMKRPKLTTT